jgi:Protein of unknown function (DUF2442)
VIESNLPRRQLRFVLARAEPHQDELRENWASRPRGWDTAVDQAAPMIGLTPDITNQSWSAAAFVRLRFADGLTGEVDVLDRMRRPMFDQARTAEGFAAVTVDPETGPVVWPGGADLAPPD